MTRTAAASVEHVYREALGALRRARLAYGHGTHDARQEAGYFVSFVLGVSPEALDEHRRQLLSRTQARRIERLVSRRIAERIPAAYLTREAWLEGLPFHVDRRVIVPRSHIAGLLGGTLDRWLARRPRRILDLCTGSGCLAVLAALAYPRAKVDACDISTAALAVARRNVERYSLGKRVRLIRSDLLSDIGGARYDLIVSNPPYVGGRSMARLPPEYLYEPRRALAGGTDGLDVVRRILAEAAAYLTGHGVLVCEIGANRGGLERAYPRLPFTWLQTDAGSDEVFLLDHSQLAREVANER